MTKKHRCSDNKGISQNEQYKNVGNIAKIKYLSFIFIINKIKFFFGRRRQTKNYQIIQNNKINMKESFRRNI